MSADRAELVALATFVFDTVGTDLYEYNIEPYSNLISGCVEAGDTTAIGEALVAAFLAQKGSPDHE